MRAVGRILHWLIVFSFVFIVVIGASQAASKLDTNFGENGFVVKDFGNGNDELFAVATQTDGNIIVAGYYYNAAVKNLVVARYLPTGELDTTFNNDGIFTHSMGTGDTVANSLAIQSDGLIVVAGSANDVEHNLAVLRLTKEGFPDTTFGDNGQVLLPITGGQVDAYKVRLASTGEIFVAGTVVKDGGAGTYGIVAKLTATGQSDAAFGDVGMSSLLQYDYNTVIRALALQIGGKIVIAGSLAVEGTPEAGLLRLNENGTIDETFGQTGQSMLALGGSGSIINDIILDPAGSLLAVGEFSNGTYLQTFVASFNGNGVVDPGFADSGIYRNTLGSENVGQAIAVQGNGTLLVAGFESTDKGKDVYLLTVDKTSDPASEDKVSTTYTVADLAGTDDFGNALAVTTDGSVFVAGSTGKSDNKDLALLRFVGLETKDVLAGNAVDAGVGITTSGYTLLTKPVTGVSRVGGVSGGIITDNGSNTCEKACMDTCSTDTSATSTCYESCFSACVPLTITLRGVVYGVKESPVYDKNSTEDSSTSTTSSSTSGTTSTTGTTSSSTNNTSTSDSSIFPQGGKWTYDIVRSGQSEDGSGTGSYDSDILEITPGTQYYVRAYAVLSDDSVIYGNEVTFKTDDACFIATAAFGSILDRHVTVLREFRDRVMMVSTIGQRLVGMYYRISPPIADLVGKHKVLRAVVRTILVPFVLLAYFILKTGIVTKVCVLAASIGGLALISRKTQKTQGILV